MMKVVLQHGRRLVSRTLHLVLQVVSRHPLGPTLRLILALAFIHPSKMTMTMDIDMLLPNPRMHTDQECMVMNRPLAPMKFLMVHLPLTSDRLYHMKASMEPLLFLMKSLVGHQVFLAQSRLGISHEELACLPIHLLSLM
ncbi:hypothetical protein ARMGADRAFT_600725 [Armillaria gallica]|uniref:Uncharacterized protein n=1 Tax=Armillaria gallica TaxID=47427 RepID=A0A2H3CNN4_ARMGA|nr:hypothetical protein ARMGADRAFT_600725 [Armillaria gallica]